MHWKGVKNQAEECVIAGSLQLFPGQAVDEMIASKVEDVGVRRSRQGTRKTSPEGFRYKNVFRGEEGLK